MIQRLQPGARLSGAVIHAAVVYLSGQVPEDATADIQVQTQSVLSRIDRLLADAGTDKSHLLTVTIYLADISDFAAMNKVWENWAIQGSLPARTTVEARLANPAYRIEVTATAAVGPGA
jgi:enamine deaminase RidA (YjgF/YER057c/UK114 family)